MCVQKKKKNKMRILFINRSSFIFIVAHKYQFLLNLRRKSINLPKKKKRTFKSMEDNNMGLNERF